jgi:hypothetical protein
MIVRSYFCFIFIFIKLIIIETNSISSSRVTRPNTGNIDIEQQLIGKLLQNYNKKLRPSGTVEVKFALNINQIIKLEEKDQIFMLNAFLDHEWIDNRLSWSIYSFFMFYLIFKYSSVHLFLKTLMNLTILL